MNFKKLGIVVHKLLCRRADGTLVDPLCKSVKKHSKITFLTFLLKYQKCLPGTLLSKYRSDQKRMRKLISKQIGAAVKVAYCDHS